MLSSKGSGTFLKHAGKYTGTGEVLIGSKPTPSFLHLHNMTFRFSKGSRAGNWIPRARTALLHKVWESPFHLNCKKLKNTWNVKKPHNNRDLYAQTKYAVLLSLLNAVRKSRAVFFASMDECVFSGSVLGCKIRIPSYLVC